MKTYIKKNVIERTAEKLNKEPKDISRTVDAVFTVIREIMAEADPECRIEIRDFGVFEVKRTKAKPKARNPKTNQEIYVPPRRKTHFKPGKLLKTALKRPL
ncbi:MAG: integration host factor subunit beta [bacterium]|jgi:integration host factor subunit beta|nr:integration host factor subunit beta [bacterium]